MQQSDGGVGQGNNKKRKKTAVVPTDGLVADRITALKKKITGSKREDNEWTQMLRDKLDQDTVK